VPVLTPGSVVKSSTAPGVYLVDGTRSLAQVMSMDMLAQLGRGWSTVAPSDLAGYDVGAPMSTVMSCDGVMTVAVRGRLQAVSVGYGLRFRTVAASTCRGLPQAPGVVAAPIFVKSPSSPTLYLVDWGSRRPIRSMATLAWLVGSGPYLLTTLEEPELAVLSLGSPL